MQCYCWFPDEPCTGLTYCTIAEGSLAAAMSVAVMEIALRVLYVACSTWCVLIAPAVLFYGTSSSILMFVSGLVPTSGRQPKVLNWTLSSHIFSDDVSH